MTTAHCETRWHTMASVDELQQQIATRLVDYANDCIAQCGCFHVVLAGGNTPRAIYERLRTAPTDWSRWHVYFGDERCLPAGDAERNDSMAHTALLDHVPIPRTQIHAIPAHLPTQACLAHYSAVLAAIETFDLVLLGLGEDGHTASLFPEHERGDRADAPAVLAVFDAPKPPPTRISLSARRLSAAQQAWFLVTGSGKRAALQHWQAGDNLPAAAIQARHGIDVFFSLA